MVARRPASPHETPDTVEAVPPPPPPPVGEEAGAVPTESEPKARGLPGPQTKKTPGVRGATRPAARRSRETRRRRARHAAALRVCKTAIARQAGRKPHRFHPGTVALREIKQYQRNTHRLLRRAPFRRLLREVVAGINPDTRLQSCAIEALQEAAESYLTVMFQEANLLAIHARRTTVTRKDLQLARALRARTEKPASVAPEGGTA